MNTNVYLVLTHNIFHMQHFTITVTVPQCQYSEQNAHMLVLKEIRNKHTVTNGSTEYCRI